MDARSSKVLANSLKGVALVAFMAYAFWWFVNPNSDRMSGSPSEFYKGKNSCLNDTQSNRDSRPEEITSCRWYDLAKFKMAARYSDEEILEFFVDAIDEGKTPEVLEDEVALFIYPIERLAKQGDAKAQGFIRTMQDSGRLRRGEDIQSIVASIKVAAKNGDEEAKSIMADLD